jgi:hypothetical protein
MPILDHLSTTLIALLSSYYRTDQGYGRILTMQGEIYNEKDKDGYDSL